MGKYNGISWSRCLAKHLSFFFKQECCLISVVRLGLGLALANMFVSGRNGLQKGRWKAGAPSSLVHIFSHAVHQHHPANLIPHHTCMSNKNAN